MPSTARLRGALDALFAELATTAAWEREIADEARRAAGQRDRLAQSLRCTIATLSPEERGPELLRLREALGQPRPQPVVARTERIRLALDWLVRRDPPEFHVSELTAHLAAHGHRFGRGYLSALLDRWTKAGVVDRIDRGRYSVNREQVDISVRDPNG